MYSTCLFCRGALGHNEHLEIFPVGRRLAFDRRTGRLWVICVVCRRWNLTPLEERWEAVEQCERAARAARPVAATDQIALYRLLSGLELVRIGGASWREVAAWRYGRRLWWRHIGTQVANTASYLLPYVIAPFIAPSMVGIIAGSAIVGIGQGIYVRRRGNRVSYFIDTQDGRAAIREFQLGHATLRPAHFQSSAELTITVPSDRGEVDLVGQHAMRVAALALVRANGEGGEKQDIDYAIGFVRDAGSGEAYLTEMARRVEARTRRADAASLEGTILAPDSDFSGPLTRFPPITRLALEIAAHEATEEQALQGELTSLVEAWREAEEIAAIADNLLLPQVVRKRLRQLRRAMRRSDAAT